MIVVTDAMVQAGIDRLNQLSKNDAGEPVPMQWGDVLRETYAAMETVRRTQTLTVDTAATVYLDSGAVVDYKGNWPAPDYTKKPRKTLGWKVH